MPEEYTFLLNKSYSRESRTDFPGKREWQNCRDPGKSGTGIPGNETLVAGNIRHFPVLSAEGDINLPKSQLTLWAISVKVLPSRR
jgi:hypothetical protein